MLITKPHAALLASPGMGHLIPMVELGKRLLTLHGFDVSIFVVTTDSSTTRSQILQQTSNQSSLNVVMLPPVDVSSKLGPNPPLEVGIHLAMAESLPLLRSAILSMKVVPTVLIIDLFGILVLPMSRDLGMLNYVFMTSNAWFTATITYAPVIDKDMEDRHVNNREPLFIPGCKPVQYEDTLEPFVLRGQPMYEGFIKATKDIISVDGILINTWHDLEPTTIKALRDSEHLGWISKGPVYPVGPLVRTVTPRSGTEHGHGAEVKVDEVLRWLDGQPTESVIYVSFGSGGTLSAEQITELAWALELSRQRFVWVVRPPNGSASGTFFDVANGGDGTPGYLPEGFVKRTHNVGLVVPMWAPQAEILAHPSTGGFITHCGWNSTLESIINGVPMVAWPLYAEQKMNAAMLAEELGVAVRAKGTEGVVGREQILKLVRRIMVEKEGKAMREKVKELKRSGDKALSNVGSSYNSLSQATKDLENYLLEKSRGASAS
ncbi:hypothetical protein L6164_020005 [Bauhinia variegata]|uniref:Uncharacterized protein n=1 Tax=Bauhinia variegata TaxID=167791 RepID=A0ACB9MYD1_BAUVA|nr:hypothetical protein L6164_020005 [Bauhinia variegata]